MLLSISAKQFCCKSSSSRSKLMILWVLQRMLWWQNKIPLQTLNQTQQTSLAAEGIFSANRLDVYSC
jgi:hypothetical protein